MTVAETTAREDEPAVNKPEQWVLRWVWPEVRSVVLQGSPLTIGREEDAAIPISGPRVSRRHAELYRQGPLYVLRDLGSTNGTWLHGQAVEHAPIVRGSVLRVGDWVGVLDLEAEPLADFAELTPGLFGGGKLAAALEPVRRLAATDVPVLLIGETGTGKERFARALHELSGRPGAFVALNCAALPEQLAEAELFGYRKGAFTGAERASGGHFRAADGGTLFLDEIADLSPSLQSKLLRVLDDGQVLSLGETRPVPTNVRVVCASQQALSELVEAKAFRRDLAARLSGLKVELPPLAARRADIAPLFARFLSERAGGRPPEVESRLVEALCLHAWPENVRGLELVTRTLLAVHGHEPKLLRQHLPEELAKLVSAEPPPARAASSDRQEFDLARVKSELERSGGNVRATARRLGLSRQRIYRLLDRGPRNGAAGVGSSGESGDAGDD